MRRYITELTVGESADQALPAPLPPGIDPTHIFEFAVDEAEAMGAESVSYRGHALAPALRE